MRLLAAALLLIGVTACTGTNTKALQDKSRDAVVAMRRGNLAAAETLIAQAADDSTRAPADQAWPARFHLLDIELRLRKHDLEGASRLLSMALPGSPTPAIDALNARLNFLRGWRATLAGGTASLEEAIATLQKASQQAATDRDTCLDSQQLIGIAQYQLGRYDEGDASLHAVLADAERAGDRYHEATSQLNLGFGLLVRKRYDAALGWFERVLALDDLSGYTVYADALNNAGICHSRLGQFDSAAEAQQRAVALHERGARREYEQALGQLGTTYWRWNKTREGVPYLEKALAVATEAGLTSDAGVWAGNLADAYIDLGDWPRAAALNDQSRQLKEAAKSKDLFSNTLRDAEIALNQKRTDDAARLLQGVLASTDADPSVRWSAYEGLANVALASGRRDEAMAHFQAALETIEKTRSDLVKTDYKLSFLTRLISFYRRYVDALVDSGKIERALELADSSRGRVLAERQGVASSSDATAARLKALSGRTDTVFLSYWLAPQRSYLWIVTPSAVRLVNLPPAAELDALVDDYRSAIANVMANPLAPGGSGDKLFQTLIAPALSSVPPGSHVLIVPDGSLHTINFETLPAPGELRRRYWVEDVEVQIAPALGLVGQVGQVGRVGQVGQTGQAGQPGRAGQAGTPNVLIIGNPTPRNPEFPALTYAAAEMSSVARHFPAGRVTSIAGADAVPAAYRAASPESYSILHFTAHATANLESPLDSAVILSGPDTGFKLYARDVASEPLHAELVTVSACRSAGERTYSGEGLIGFAWAFLRGGAQRVVAGLWDVDDKATADLMDRLYTGVAAGKPIAQSLREAKLALIARGGTTAQPYYWGPLQLFTVRL